MPCDYEKFDLGLQTVIKQSGVQHQDGAIYFLSTKFVTNVNLGGLVIFFFLVDSREASGSRDTL